MLCGQIVTTSDEERGSEEIIDALLQERMKDWYKMKFVKHCYREAKRRSGRARGSRAEQRRKEGSDEGLPERKSGAAEVMTR